MKDLFKKPAVIVTLLILAILVIYFLFSNKSIKIFRKSRSNERINCTSNAMCQVLLDRPDVECGANRICQYTLANTKMVQTIIVRPKGIVPEKVPTRG